ncbi:MAG TPA: hypothetical protein PLC42_06935, partial [Parachlamydiaceae bacterium]|nr:hypothetical protein [Parachlamydiaceae bacterium]
MINNAGNSDYSQKLAGYGRLTESQAAQVKENKGKTVKQLSSDDSNLGRLLNEVLRAKQEAKEPKKLTKVQKKNLSNVQKDIVALKNEVKVKDLKKADAATQKDIQKLEKFLLDVQKDIESLKKESLRNKGEKIGAEQLSPEFDGPPDYLPPDLETYILQQAAKLPPESGGPPTDLPPDLETYIRMATLKDVHASIANAKAERERLVEKYEYRKEEFANFKTPSKISSLDQQSFKDELGKFDKQIQSFEKLEKKLGEQGIQKEQEEKLFQDVNKELASIKQETEKISSTILNVIKNSEHNHMNLSERIFLIFSRFFSF